MKNCECGILYHLGKANVVANALSRKIAHSAALITRHNQLNHDFEQAEFACCSWKSNLTIDTVDFTIDLQT